MAPIRREEARGRSAILVSHQPCRGGDRPIRRKIEARRLQSSPPMEFELDEFRVSRTMLACAGMGATMGMLLGGTLLGVASAVAAAIIGALGAGILGHFVEPKESSECPTTPSERSEAHPRGAEFDGCHDTFK